MTTYFLIGFLCLGPMGNQCINIASGFKYNSQAYCEYARYNFSNELSDVNLELSCIEAELIENYTELRPMILEEQPPI